MKLNFTYATATRYVTQAQSHITPTASANVMGVYPLHALPGPRQTPSFPREPARIAGRAAMP